jgi:hypothetical protein
LETFHGGEQDVESIDDFHFTMYLSRYAQQESWKQWDIQHDFDVKYQVGCVILRHRKVISKGFNFHSFGKTNTCTCHAEMLAIYRHMKQRNQWATFQWLLRQSYQTIPLIRGQSVCASIFNGSTRKAVRREKFDLIVIRIMANGQLSSAKPCAECSRWIRVAQGIGVEYTVFYSDVDGTLKQFDDQPSSKYIPKNTYF